MAPDCSVCLYWPRKDAGSMARLTRETLLGTGPLATGGVYLFMNIPNELEYSQVPVCCTYRPIKNSASARGLLCNGFRARLKLMSPPHCETRRRRDRTSLRTAPTAGLGAGSRERHGDRFLCLPRRTAARRELGCPFPTHLLRSLSWSPSGGHYQ